LEPTRDDTIGACDYRVAIGRRSNQIEVDVERRGSGRSVGVDVWKPRR
jgi:hypothetical protein